MELFGLVSMIDDHHFGSEYLSSLCVSGLVEASLRCTLRKRLQPICKRTLRGQVQEAGHINYTNRIAKNLTLRGNEEVKLYESVSAYLQRENTIGFGQRSNPLLILVARKTLGSSTAAIAQFLDKVILRLTNLKIPDEELLEDIETIDEIAEELDQEEILDEPEAIDQKKLADEIEELAAYRDLALSIKANAKGEKLISKLPEVMDEIVRLGGQRKAVIFTESVRTQKYLANLLGENGYEGQVVMMNGSNNDPDSRQIYADWLERHQGTEAISGSRAADMKAAIVDAFKSDEKSILIATESGAEGINLQFCSLLVNFDLPWNPSVLNSALAAVIAMVKRSMFLWSIFSTARTGLRHVFMSFLKASSSFSAVSGASDEVLGVIESGVDFEKSVLNIFQSARTDEEIQQEFDFLQENLQDKIDKDLKDARNKIFASFDEQVVTKLRTRKGAIDTVLDNFTRSLITIAKAELPEASFDTEGKPQFEHEGKTWSTEWPLAEENGWQFFRLSDGNLAQELVDEAKARELPKEPHTYNSHCPAIRCGLPTLRNCRASLAGCAYQRSLCKQQAMFVRN